MGSVSTSSVEEDDSFVHGASYKIKTGLWLFLKLCLVNPGGVCQVRSGVKVKHIIVGSIGSAALRLAD